MRADLFALSLALAISCSGGAPPLENDGTSSSSPAVAHGDHSPQHGGLVLMHDDLHFEVVLDPEGRHRVYLTDALRRELPASAASEVRITILRSESEPESLELEVDEFGESWVAEGRSVDEPGSRAVVFLVHQDQPYEIELPFFDPSVPDPHASH